MECDSSCVPGHVPLKLLFCYYHCVAKQIVLDNTSTPWNVIIYVSQALAHEHCYFADITVANQIVLDNWSMPWNGILHVSQDLFH